MSAIVEKRLQHRERTKQGNGRVQSLLDEIGLYQVKLTDYRNNLAVAHNALNESYRRHNDLLDQSLIGFVELDRAGRIRDLNKRLADILGFSREWLIAKSFITFVTRDDVPRFLSYVSDVKRSSQSLNIDVQLTAELSSFPVRISTTREKAGANITLRMALVDLRDIKDTEKQLQQALVNWRAVLRSTPDVIMTIEETGRIVFVNRPIWRRSVQELLSTNILDLAQFKQRMKLRQCMEHAFTGKLSSCEIGGLKGNTHSWYSFTFSPLDSTQRHSRGSLRLIVVSIREISEAKKTEEQMRTSSEQRREFAAGLDIVREEERTRLAREIHDELGQALTILKLELSWLHAKTPPKQKAARHKMNSILEHVDQTIQRVRQIASDLRPPVLDDLGLIPALEWQLTDFRKRTRLTCRFKSTVEKLDLRPDCGIAVFRAVQEGLTNIARHANATAIDLAIEKVRGSLHLILSDNGHGMNVESAAKGRLGIVGMKERITRAGGTLAIHSAPGKGTRLEVTLPL